MSDQIWWYFKCAMCCIVKTVLCLMCRNRDLIINSTSGTVFFIALITQWPAHTQQTVYAGCHGCERAGCSTKQWLCVIHPCMVQWMSGMLSCKPTHSLRLLFTDKTQFVALTTTCNVRQTDCVTTCAVCHVIVMITEVGEQVSVTVLSVQAMLCCHRMTM